MEMEILFTKINLRHTCIKLKVSIDDIKFKNPHRTDLINSMQQTLNEVTSSILTFELLEKEFRTARQMNFNLERLNLELKQEVKDLKKQIEFNNLEL
jgi:hypothetical protein